METAGQHCPIHHSGLPPLALHAEQPPGDLWPLASHGVLIPPSASGSTAVAAEGGVLGPQLGSRVPAGPPRQPSSREPGPDTDVAVQQLKGRAAGGATFEAMPISGLKMYGTPVKLSSFHAAMATGSRLWRGWREEKKKRRVTFVLPVCLAFTCTHTIHISVTIGKDVSVWWCVKKPEEMTERTECIWSEVGSKTYSYCCGRSSQRSVRQNQKVAECFHFLL